MDLNEIRVFVKVAQAGSFHRAAEQIGIPNSTASAKVSALERRLGVTLLQRTTRRLRLTEAGETFFQRSSKALEQLSGAEAEVRSAQQEVSGHLRVTVPIDLGSTCLIGLISAFKRKFPQVSVELILSDELKDLVAEGIDLAIRAGDLEDSGLIARKLGLTSWAPFAGPHYLRKAKSLVHPKDLAEHACLHFSALGDEGWELTRERSTVRVRGKEEVRGNDLHLIKALAVAGNGIALLPAFACRAEVKAGKLVRVLPSWSAFTDPLHLVFPHQKFVSPKVRAFADMAIEEFRNIL